jgi:Fic family protein
LLDAQPNTASKLISDFRAYGILRELTGRKRDRLFIFNDYVRLFVEG